MKRLLKCSPFSLWILKYGIERLASDLDMTDEIVARWVRGDNLPRPRVAAKIIQISGLSWDDIYGHLIAKR